MTAVIAARFESFAAADSAAHALFAAGVAPEGVNVFSPRVNRSASLLDLETDPEVWERFEAPAAVAGLATTIAILCAAIVLAFQGAALTMLVAGALGAFLGAWIGARWLAVRHRMRIRGAGDASALLTAHVDKSQFDSMRALLCDAGALRVELSRGQWAHGQWYGDLQQADLAPTACSSSQGARVNKSKTQLRTHVPSKAPALRRPLKFRVRDISMPAVGSRRRATH